MEDTPPVATQPASVPTAAPAVTDRRPSPRGVLPRGVQTWLLAGLAAFMLLIMFVVGRPEAPTRPAPAAAAAVTPSADRVRDYQDRLRALEAQTLSQLAEQQTAPVVDPRAYSEPSAPPPADPIAQERRRREYESLFASNVVLSRRPESQRPDVGRSETSVQGGMPTAGGTPTVDEIADAAVRSARRRTWPDAICTALADRIPVVRFVQENANGAGYMNDESRVMRIESLMSRVFAVPSSESVSKLGEALPGRREVVHQSDDRAFPFALVLNPVRNHWQGLDGQLHERGQIVVLRQVNSTSDPTMQLSFDNSRVRGNRLTLECTPGCILVSQGGRNVGLLLCHHGASVEEHRRVPR